jgi:hypothetical protein
MNSTISVKKLGFAVGITGTCLYIGCMFVMATTGHDGTVKFFNSLLHGLDVSSIIQMNVSLWEAGVGVIETFIIGWLIGACIAGFYNVSFNKKS